MRLIGIDPGKSGAIAVVDSNLGTLLDVFSFTDQDEMEIVHWLATEELRYVEVFIEDVHSSPQQGVASAFTFGRGYGLLLGALYAGGATVRKVRPAEWQSALGCLSGGDKKIPFERAKKLYPTNYARKEFNKSSADAVLIAHYGYKFMKHNKKEVDSVPKDPFPY